MEVVETGPNPEALCALARQDQDARLHALPRPQKGIMVQVRHSRDGRRVEVRTHGSTLACLALPCGRLLATASSMGTLVRVFSTDDGIKLQEVCVGF